MTTFVSKQANLLTALASFYHTDSKDSIPEAYAAVLKLPKSELRVASSYQELAEIMRISDRPSELRFLTPSVFSVGDSNGFFWIERPGSFVWKTLRDTIQTTTPRTAMLLAPVSWQLGALFFEECDRQNVTSCVFDAVNTSSADLVLKNHPIDLLVTTSNAFKTLIEMNTRMPQNVMIIETFGKLPLLLSPDNTAVTYDLHLFPGVPIAYAKEHRHGETFTFEPNDDHLFIVESAASYVTSLSENTPPLCHYQIPAVCCVPGRPNQLMYVQ